jgi:hypothetical protein
LWSALSGRGIRTAHFGIRGKNDRFSATVVDLTRVGGDDLTKGCTSITTGCAMSNSWPEADELSALFQGVRNGDKLAITDFLAAILDPLVNHLHRWRPQADEHACLTAAEDAVLALLRDPTIYDPAQRGLIGFLRMAAERDLENVLQKELRHHRKRENRDCVELAPDPRNSEEEGLADDLPSFDDSDIAVEIDGFTATERAVFELMRTGERATAAYVPLLGIEHLPEAEQAREVKRVKDRIIKRLQRAGGKS